MPIGPKGEKRPGNNLASALMVARLATGEEEETYVNEGMSEGGKMGGKARADGMTPERRKEIATKAAGARWGKG